MLPQPLHPAVVHFPIVLAVLLPVVTLAGILAVRRGGGVAAGRIGATVREPEGVSTCLHGF